ncbi:MAG: aspartate/glutamate racemase family protein [Candidatus Binatia bacterium]
MRIMFLNHSSRREASAQREARIVSLLNSYASSGTTVELHYPDDLGAGAALRHLEQQKTLSGLHHILETPALVKRIIEAERDGFDAVVQSNTFDPGVEAARLAVRIPVVGVLRASCHFAACLCDRFGFIVPLESHVPYVFRLLETYRMGQFVTDIKTVNVYESDMAKQHKTILQRAVSLSREMIDGGAQAIIPLGGLLFPYEVDPKELEQEVGIPVINTKAVGIRFAELMVSSKITHSPKAYPWSPGLKAEDISRRSDRTG